MSSASNRLIELYRAGTLVEANALLAELESAGITAQLTGEDLQNSFGTVGWAFSPCVMINSANETEARSVLNRFVASLSGINKTSTLPPDTCLSCGKGMSQDLVCKNCGWTFIANRDDWHEPPPKVVQPATEPVQEKPNTIYIPRQSNRQLWCEVCAVLAVVCVPNLISTVEAIVDPQTTTTQPYWFYLAKLASFAVSDIYLVIYLIHRSGDGFARFGLVRPHLVKDLGLALLFYVCEKIVWSMTIPNLVSKDWVTKNDPINKPVGSTEIAGMILMMSLTALAEEISMRGYLIPRLSHLLKSRFGAVLVSTLLFAAYHGYQGAIGFLNAVEFGIFTGIAFLFCRRIWPLAIFHAVGNILLELRF